MRLTSLTSLPQIGPLLQSYPVIMRLLLLRIAEQPSYSTNLSSAAGNSDGATIKEPEGACVRLRLCLRLCLCADSEMSLIRGASWLFVALLQSCAAAASLLHF